MWGIGVAFALDAASFLASIDRAVAHAVGRKQAPAAETARQGRDRPVLDRRGTLGSVG